MSIFMSVSLFVSMSMSISSCNMKMNIFPIRYQIAPVLGLSNIEIDSNINIVSKLVSESETFSRTKFSPVQIRTECV
jgi:hypothetical protein